MVEAVVDVDVMKRRRRGRRVIVMVDSVDRIFECGIGTNFAEFDGVSVFYGNIVFRSFLRLRIKYQAWHDSEQSVRG